AALLRGFAVRTLYNQSELGPEKAQRLLSRALSPSVTPAAAGEWLEGFLADGGEMVLHDAPLLSAIDGWLLPLTEEDLTNLVPMLRRAFSSCDAGERRRLLDMVRQPVSAAPVQPGVSGGADADAPGFAAALPLLLTILGLNGKEGGA